MTFSSLFPSPCILLVLLVGFNFVAGNTVIQDVCSRTGDPAYCYNFFGSDPRWATADRSMLAAKLIDMMTYNATSTKVKIHSLSERAQGDLKQRLYMCGVDYDDMLDALTGAQDYLKSSNYNLVAEQALAIHDDLKACESSFAPNLKSPLTDDNSRLGKMNDILLHIDLH